MNRIILKEIEGRGDCNHTYINASYIDVRTTVLLYSELVIRTMTYHR